MPLVEDPLASVAEQSLDGLVAAAGERAVISDPSACAAYAVDGRVPQWVVYPRSAEVSAAALQYAAERNLAVIPCCNTTKLSAGNAPRQYDLALCLKEMNQVRHYEPDDLTVSVDPGVGLGDLERLLNSRGLWLPLDPPGAARASMGGIVATNAAGALRLKYGAPRDMVVGMKIATASGNVVKAGGRVVKNVAGYDLSKLMIGSYGTLGVIVEINFKLYPAPARRATWSFQIPSLDAARAFRRKLLNSPLSPMRMVLLDAGATAIARGKKQARGFEIWAEVGGSDSVIRRSAGVLQDISKASGATPSHIEDDFANKAWNRIVDFGSAAGLAAEYIILKAALPIAAAGDFMEAAQQEAQRAEIPIACFCHNGVGIVHVCLLPQDQVSGLPDIIASLRQVAVARGGSLTVLRCPAELKSQIDAWGPVGDGFDLMRKLKDAWDPKGTLSPGRFVGGL